MKTIFMLAAMLLSGLLLAQTTVYVNPSAATNGTGTQASPFNNIPNAAAFVAANGGGEVLVTAGTHVLTNSQKITAAATFPDSVVIKPETPYSVKFEFAVRSAFDIQVGSSYITLQGFEIDGNTDEENDFWCVVAQDLWSDFGNPRGGGLAVIADGEHINVYDNYIHDCYQKGVEIADGRYVNVHGNIIRNIAQYSLSGGHGIMRQQAGDLEYDDPDDPNFYRWDIHGNLIFNVEQRIYSWVPRKGFMEMVIDEGKSILIDDPKQTNGTLDVMKARIKNNVVAFGAVDHIRLKSTPGLEVSNNSIFSEGLNGDGITDKVADDNPNGPNTMFTNFTAHGNAAQTVAGIFAIEIDHCTGESYGAGNDPMGNTPAGAVTNNYVAVGRYKPRNEPNIGITDANTNQLFVNPTQGDFSINPALGLPAGVGVDPAILADLNAKATAFGTTVAWDGWVTDNLKLSQTILDNIPGVNDGVVGNELVFTDAGTMDNTYEHIEFNVVDGSWKTARNSPDIQEFALNPEYTAWYETTITSNLNAAGGEYNRIRYGDSEIKQDQLFVEGWLTASYISAERTTLINGHDNNFVLDGDLLITFEGLTPQIGDTYDLMIAGSITAADPAPLRAGNSLLPTDLFDRVLFAGFTPDEYSLTVVPVGGQEVLRLTILEELPVTLTSFSGTVVDKRNHLLRWETNYEEDNDFFEVQRSSGGGVWTAIGRVAPVANGQSGGTYRFNDLAPPAGESLYRLRQVDLDGTFTYSEIVYLSNTSTAGLIVFPNPVTDQFRVVTSASRKDLRLFNPLGQDVTSRVSISVLDNGFRVATSALRTGVYLLDVGGVLRKVDIRR